jgi:hypothetical protein
MRKRSAFMLALVVGCEKPPPAFGGVSDAGWLAVDFPIGDVSRDEVIEGFVVRAKEADCRTDRLGTSARAWPDRGGVPHPQAALLAKHTVAVIAYCAAGDLALFIHDDARASYGCRRPVDEDTCRARLRAVIGPEDEQPSP